MASNQVQWARQYLVWEGLLDGSKRGYWTLTPNAWSVKPTKEESHKIFLKWVSIHQANRKKIEKEVAVNPGAIHQEEIFPDEIHEEELIHVLRSLPPKGFETICQRLLHESGFENVEVTGRSHDGGIDGVGFLRLNPFIRIKTVFQCKRFKGSVGRAMIGDFRNAMLGRAEKGIMITTGTFTADATKEANREGVPQIELVDGELLVEMFEEKQLGLRLQQTFEIDHSFFDQFRKMN